MVIDDGQLTLLADMMTIDEAQARSQRVRISRKVLLESIHDEVDALGSMGVWRCIYQSGKPGELSVSNAFGINAVHIAWR